MSNLARAKFEESMSGLPDFKGSKGSIVRLKIEDFMTYRNVEMRAGPHVNLIMGPNGTGKSTIVCAICLALAGKPKILGRAHSLKEYIRHGASRASVEIELFNPESLIPGGDGNWIIKRVIQDLPNHHNGVSTEWFLNGRKCRENQVEKLMKSLNIQLDNLCQFLPQDRVQDFAKMDSIQLLKSTEKSIDSNDGDRLAEKHERLITIKDDIKKMRQTLEKSDESLRVEMQQNARLENEVRAFQDRERMKQDIEQLEGKKLWLLYQHALNRFSERKKMYEEREVVKKREEELLAPSQKEIELMKTKLTECRNELNKLRSYSVNTIERSQRQYRDAADVAETEVDKCKAILEAAEKTERDRGKKIEELKERIQGVRRELDELVQRGDTNYEELNQQILELGQQQKNFTNKICEINGMNDTDHGDLRLAQNQLRQVETELRAMSDFRSSRMRYLERRNPDVAKAVEFFSDPNNLQAAGFARQIHEPLMLQIYVNDLNYGKIAERCIPPQDLVAFFCEAKEDVRKMMAISKERGWRISCIHHDIPPNFRKPQANWYSEETMRAYDFQKNLVDLIEAPDYYMSYLCKHVRPQDVLIGTQNTEKMAGEIIENTNMRIFFTMTYAYTIRTSSYTGEKNSSISYIQNASVFTDQINAVERERLTESQLRCKRDIARLENQIAGRRQQLEQLMAESNAIGTRMKEINERMDYSKRVKRRLESFEANLRTMEEDRVDLNALRRECRQKVLEAKMVQEQALTRYNKCTTDVSEKWLSMLAQKRQTSILHNAVTRKQRELEDARVKVQALIEELRGLEAERGRAAEIAKKRKAEARSKTNARDPPDDVRNGEVNEEDLDMEINQLQAQMNFLPDTDDSVLRDYHLRKRKIAEMKNSKEQLEADLSQLEAQMLNAKREWVEPLRELIARINTNFSKFFANMQCVGEVTLDHAEDENDFSKYGVKILVKFRASEPLVELSGWKQSGGERAITTALYILALQELTRVPFRVIDEINQGMDAKNEARFFELLCSLARGEDTPQYFLLTPKLLPPVEYPDNVDFHIIFNGPHVEVVKDPVEANTSGEEVDDGEEQDTDDSSEG